MGRRITAAALGLLFLAAAPAPASNPFLGTWTVADAKMAPWVNPAEYEPVVNPKILHAKLTFTAAAITGPQPIGCTKAIYELKTVEPDYLFEGGLTDPKRQAHELGFTSDNITALEESCDRPDADVEMSYALVDANTAVFALDNFIYVMKRTPPR